MVRGIKNKFILAANAVISTVLLLALSPISAQAVSATDFTPQRLCTATTIPTTAQYFSGGNLATTVSGLASGSTLVIEAGTYQISSALVISGKNNITICAAPNTRPHIRQTANAEIFSIKGGSTYIAIEGLELSSIADKAHDQVIGVHSVEGSHHIRVWDVWARDLPGCGICSTKAKGHHDIRYNRVWNTAAYNRNQNSAIQIWANQDGGGSNDEFGYSNYIIGNMVWGTRNLVTRGTGASCIAMRDNNGTNKWAGFTGYTLIANNLCTGNDGMAIRVYGSNFTYVVNNTLYQNALSAGNGSGIDTHAGEMSAAYSSHVRFINNVAVASPQANVFDSWGMGTNVEFAGNIFSGSTDRQPAGGFVMVPDVGFTNPNLNASIGDFRPATGSVLIGSGVGSYTGVVVPAVDFLGLPRTVGAPSVGAFEPVAL